MPSMPVRWKLQSILRQHRISTYRLWKESGLAMATAYRLARGDSKYVNAETLDRVLGALERLTGTPFQVGDLVNYEPAVAYVVHGEPSAVAAVERLMRTGTAATARGAGSPESRGEALVETWVTAGLAFVTEGEAIDHASGLRGTGTQHVLAIGRSDIEEALSGADTIERAKKESGSHDG